MDARCSTAPKHSCFARPATSKELEQSSKGFLLKNTKKKRPMGYAGISGLAKKTELVSLNLTEEKDHCPEDILSTDNAETLAKWLSLLWHGVLGYKSIVT